MIISQRRVKEHKGLKDKNTAIEILKALSNKGEGRLIRETLKSIPRKWKQKVIKGLEKAASVIFGHNHPSGDPEPSEDDLYIRGLKLARPRILIIEDDRNIYKLLVSS